MYETLQASKKGIDITKNQITIREKCIDKTEQNKNEETFQKKVDRRMSWRDFFVCL